MHLVPPRAFRPIKRILLGLLILNVLLLDAFVVYDRMGVREFDRWLRLEQKRGTKLSLKDAGPAIPDDQNFGALPVFRQLAELPRKERPYPLLIPEVKGGSNYDPRTTGRFEPMVWRDALVNNGHLLEGSGDPIADVEQVYARFDRELAPILDGIDRPFTKFPNGEELTPSSGYAGVLNRVAVISAVRAQLSLEKSDTAAALRELQVQAKLISHLRDSPGVIGAVFQRVGSGMLVSVVLHGLQEHRWSDAELAECVRILEGINPLRDLKTALQFEFAAMSDACDTALADNRVFSKKMWPPPEWFQNGTFIQVFPGVLRRNQMKLGQFYAVWGKRIDLRWGIIRDDIPKPDGAHCTCHPNWSAYYQIFDLLAPNLDSIEDQCAITTIDVRMATVACALQRHILKHGSYPNSLQELAPDYLNSVPREVYSLEPLCYRRTAPDQFKLYSRGFDRVDDGGEYLTPRARTRGVYRNRPGRKDILDLSWPATPPRSSEES